MKKTDLLLFMLALISALGIWMFYSAGAEKGMVAVITVDGEERAELPMDKSGIVPIETDWGYNIVMVEDGKAFVVEADCRDQICVDHKKIEKTGETIVCLPHKMVVEIIGGEEEMDMVVG